MSASIGYFIRFKNRPMRGVGSQFSTERSRLTTLLLAGKTTVPLPRIAGLNGAMTAANLVRLASEAGPSGQI